MKTWILLAAVIFNLSGSTSALACQIHCLSKKAHSCCQKEHPEQNKDTQKNFCGDPLCVSRDLNAQPALLKPVAESDQKKSTLEKTTEFLIRATAAPDFKNLNLPTDQSLLSDPSQSSCSPLYILYRRLLISWLLCSFDIFIKWLLELDTKETHPWRKTLPP